MTLSSAFVVASSLRLQRHHVRDVRAVPGTPQEGGDRYQRGFTDLDGHHWEALCLVEPTG